uniref:tRNA modification GTPase MnmE n=1 Tax=Acidobacterium capsulatum TaxID=33075 RepID=A0A7V4XSJ7_9BACT
MENLAHETIVAISTPPGRGGIGIVRLSGPRAVPMAETLVRLRHPLQHASARFAEIYEPLVLGEPLPEGSAEAPRKLDEAVVTCFQAPRSYTGEDLVEIAAHGSPVVLEMLVRAALAQGARLARPGEFTERAFLSGRLDLTQAEAVRDLIDAQTLYQARVAAEQMGGALSRRVQPAKQQLVELIALLEAGIDFAEDDVDVTPYAQILTRIDAMQPTLESLHRSFERGRLVHSGLTLAIVGRPNVGKSSLFNRLVERERAIVTAMPGTTRDLVSERVSLGGIPLELVDTAGLREGADEAETIGIQKSREALADADLVMLVVEDNAPLSEEEQTLAASLAGRRALLVRNKSDLVQQQSLLDTPPEAYSEKELGTVTNIRVVSTSALTGEGIARLRETLLQMMQAEGMGSESGMLTSLRHHEAVTAALGALGKARAAAQAGIPHEMVLLDLYEALRQLDSLTGETTADDILNRIFSTFCIGK